MHARHLRAVALAQRLTKPLKSDSTAGFALAYRALHCT